MPEVSVITPVKNGAQYITDAVLSVEQQGYDCEHIIVDDCSEDSTWDTLLRLSADRSWVRIFKMPKSAGAVTARNIALSHAKAKYIAFLDADDIWLPDKLKIQISFMKENDFPFTFTDYHCISADTKRIGRRVSGVSKINWHLHHMTRFIACSSVVLDSLRFNKLQFWDVSPAKRGEDFLMWSNCLLMTSAAVRCPHALTLYRLVKKSRSSGKFSGLGSIFTILYKIEKNTLIESLFYLGVSTIFAAAKHIWQRPIRPAEFKRFALAAR
jgi:teichuronic acid biosynthesis glycosyltransferase TuaG